MSKSVAEALADLPMDELLAMRSKCRNSKRWLEAALERVQVELVQLDEAMCWEPEATEAER